MMEQVLQKTMLFKGIPESEIADILNGSRYRVTKFTKESLIAHAGDPIEEMIILMDGTLEGAMLDLAGNKLKIELLNGPMLIAAAFVYGKKNRFPVNLLAKTDGRLLRIDKKSFTQLLTTQSQLLINYLNIISNKAQFLTEKITFLSFKTIRQKLAFFLLKRGQNEIELKESQSALAELFGVTRPSLARTIGELTSNNIILWERKKVVILDLQALKDILME
ncbi:Crp/Fnr family transcriptional regulator [Halosquirtibacter xylanolyticus]|uniref:Crp/Fnr family transcriptional regulator n=1 Tax=Halosquirtibacter xylanolyticus TaxID=3374599 RepID=UPI003749BF50|nr:Crp/Fnr family transcriptional regulator [Prolixibacteraceae bacterium]